MHIADRTATTDNVEVGVYSTTEARSHFPAWGQLPRQARRDRLTGGPVAPVETLTSHNVTCTALHEYVPQLIDPSTATDDPPATLAFGDDDSSFSTSDESLNNRVGSIDITDPAADGAEFTISEYVSSLELNGYTLKELGIESASGALYNHAPLPSHVDKTNNEALVVNVSLPVSDV